MPVGAIAGGTAIAGIYSAYKQGKSADKATAATTAGAEKELAYLKEKDIEAKREWEMAYQQSLNAYNAREARLTPYRDLGGSAIGTLSGLLRPPTAASAPTPPRPASAGSTFDPSTGRLLAAPGASAPNAGTPVQFDPQTGRLVPLSALTGGR